MIAFIDNIFFSSKIQGADIVVANSIFVEDLPNLIEKYASLPDRVAIEESCVDEISEIARQGLELFNQVDIAQLRIDAKQVYQVLRTLGSLDRVLLDHIQL